MRLLDPWQIRQKIQRLAIEIVEHNHREEEIVLAGINDNGMRFARLLAAEIHAQGLTRAFLTRIRLNPAAPLEGSIEIEAPEQRLEGKVIVIADDVANTGRTIFFACRPIMEILPKKVQVAVLVDRTHKSFPISVNFVGLSLATTLRQHIDVHLSEERQAEVLLK